jgi:hypothetical protein
MHPAFGHEKIFRDADARDGAAGLTRPSEGRTEPEPARVLSIGPCASLSADSNAGNSPNRTMFARTSGDKAPAASASRT